MGNNLFEGSKWLKYLFVNRRWNTFVKIPARRGRRPFIDDSNLHTAW